MNWPGRIATHYSLLACSCIVTIPRLIAILIQAVQIQWDQDQIGFQGDPIHSDLTGSIGSTFSLGLVA